MISTLKFGGVALLLTLLLWDGGASAQAPAASPETVELAPKEMLAGSSASIDRMRGNLDQMQGLLKKAEERGDADAIQCLRDKLASSRAMVDVSLLTRNLMQEALANNNQARANAEYRKITVAETKVDQFLSEAMACLSDGNQTTDEVQRNTSGELGPEEGPDVVGVLDVDIDPPDVTPFQ